MKMNNGNMAPWVEEHELCGQTETGFRSQVRASYLISVLCLAFVCVTE